MTPSFSGWFLAILSLVTYAVGASPVEPSLLTRTQASTPECNPPDSDLTGLGVRVGVYLQIIALALAVCCGQSDTLSAIPAAIMTSLTLNIVLSMKASEHVFDAKPVIQDFWVAQLQLFLLVTLVPFMFLFGRWHHRTFGTTKCVLIFISIVYTYAQTFWFWTSGYKFSDEIVCGVKESLVFNNWTLFAQHGRYGILIVHGIGILIVVFMVPNFIRGRPGYFARLVRIVPTEYESVRALALLVACAPLVVVVIEMIETAVRRGTQDEWVHITGQWLTLGVGVFTAAEALWHLLRNMFTEFTGGPFDPEAHFVRNGGRSEEGAVLTRGRQTAVVGCCMIQVKSRI
ncbi:hypothetical protein PLICRDRAFT_38005 [Plicaturopsis crispa FD-325 SS-3]|nr:hypothetical protein PLICRDRAFT_38005 [Plicaturopsis crispa FD-325 SS-3]